MSSTDALLQTAQRSTHPRLHIRNAQEAHALFEGVRLGLFPMVRRRLSPTERELQSGEVFVWEEASYKGGLERWTDGRKWSQSRMREPFLFYEEKVMPSREEKDAKAARRARKTSDPVSPAPVDASASCGPVFRRQDRPTKLRGLTKQTYSAYVTPPGSNSAPKKWHLTAYFSTMDYNELPTVQQDPVLCTVDVPKGVYVTGKGLTRKSNRGVGSGDQPSSSSSSVVPPPPRHAKDDDACRYDTPSTSFASPRSFDHPSIATYSPGPHAQHYSLPPSSMPTPSISSSSSAFASATDDGSRSPWSSSSVASLPVTPPPMQPSLPTASPLRYNFPLQGLEQPRLLSQPTHGSPTFHQPRHQNSFDSQPSYSHSPVVFDESHSRPGSTLPPLRHTPFSSHYPGSYSLPPLDDKPSVSSPYQPPVFPQSYPSSGPGVGYPSSDVRGEAYPRPSATLSSSSSKYQPRSTMDQKALGAFRLVL